MDLNFKKQGITLLTECIGTAILVTAYSLNIQGQGMGLAMIYMMLIILMYSLGGAHFNPALTLG
jgi:glycerol uptake facilitator-like aquaporin